MPDARDRRSPPSPRRALLTSALGMFSVLATLVATGVWADHTTAWWTLAPPALAGTLLGAAGAGLAWQAAQAAREAGGRPGGAVLTAGLLGLFAMAGGLAALLTVSVAVRYFAELARAG